MNLNRRRPLSSTSQRMEKATLADCNKEANLLGVSLSRKVLDKGMWNQRANWIVNGRVVLVVMKDERPNWEALLDEIRRTQG